MTEMTFKGVTGRKPSPPNTKQVQQIAKTLVNPILPVKEAELPIFKGERRDKITYLLLLGVITTWKTPNPS